MATIIGTENADTLSETAAVDTIEGLGGDDTIILNSGQASGIDFVDGGSGSDRLVLARPAAGLFLAAFGPSSDIALASAGPLVRYTNFEHYSIHHLTGEGAADSIFAGAGDDVYYFTATNNENVQNQLNQVDLGGGANDLLVVDASGVFNFAVTAQPTTGGRSLFSVGNAGRIDYFNVERLELIGGALGDTITGLTGDDVIDGRDGNDTISGLGGDDRLTGGNGNDSLSGGEGNDILVVATGADTADGGNGNDRLVIDARALGGAVTLNLSGDEGPAYSGSRSWGGGGASVDYSNIENFTIFSNAGDYWDIVTTGAGDDVFYHYGINATISMVDQVDLGGGSNDLLVADFSTVNRHSITNLIPAEGGYDGAFWGTRLGSSTYKIKYKGVERLHFIGSTQGDSVTGFGGADILDGRGGDDILTGGGGADDISGGTGTNSIDAGDGDDVVRSTSLAIDTVEGGGGTDTAIIDYSSQTAAVTNQTGGDIAFGNGADTKVTLTSVERFIVAAGSGNDSIATLGGDDEIRTGTGTDSIDSGAGNDLLDGGAGADAMTGGSGDDIYVVDEAGDSITELAGGGTDLVRTAMATYTLSANVENLVATSAIAHEFRGNAGNNVISGEAGVDFILLQDGGDDTASGFAGNDVFYFGAAYTGADVAHGGAGRDAAVLQGNYTIVLSGGSLTGMESISLQSGANTFFGDTADNRYDFNLTSTDSLVAAGERLIVNGQSLLTGEDLTFDGSAETDGRFLIYAGHGTDILKGGAGVDVFFFEGDRWGPNDRVDGGGGRDAVVISGGTGLKQVTFAADSFTNIESISVNASLASDPTGKPSYEFVLHNGNVTAGGNLILNANSITDPAQTARFDGSAEMDGTLTMFGGAGNDVLIGGAGADRLYGGLGADDLTGGGGADVFRYDSTSESSVADPDQILDFLGGVDKIDLSRIDSNTLVAGDQAFAFIGDDAFDGTAGQLRAYESGGTWFVEGDTDGNSAADFSIIVTLTGTNAIASTDFLL